MPLTVEDYRALPVEDHPRTQLIGGELVVEERRPLHGVLHARITSALQGWVEEAPRRGLVLLSTDLVKRAGPLA